MKVEKMTDQKIGNITDVLKPPLFLTTPVSPDRIKRWPNLVSWTLPKLNYENCFCILQNDINLLKDLINGKGNGMEPNLPQDFKNGMKLDDIVRKADYWRYHSKFHTKFLEFKEMFLNRPNVSGSGGDANDTNEVRLPSFQWLQWIIYLVLRDACRLVQVILDSEKAMKFWIGLTSSPDDKEDLQLISSVISRTWYLSSLMVEELNSNVYPFLFKLTLIIRPVEGGSWPCSSEFWKVPNPTNTFMGWLRETFSLSLEPLKKKQELSSIVMSENAWIVQMLRHHGGQKAKERAKKKAEANNKSSESNSSNEQSRSSEISDHGNHAPIKGAEGKSELEAKEVKSTRNKDYKDQSDEVNLTTSITPFKCKTKLVNPPAPEVEIIVVNDSDNDEGQACTPTPAKRIKSDITPLAPTSKQKRDGTNDNNNKPPPGRIDDANRFRHFWENLFSKIFESDPNTKQGCEEMLRLIASYKSTASDSFSPFYWNLFVAFTPQLRKLEEAVQRYAATGSVYSVYDHDQFASSLAEIQEIVQHRVKGIAEIQETVQQRVKAITERIVKKKSED